MRYRPDIDGLRAVAVIGVLLFHLGVPPFTGGFVGVDVFFVISGFLITSIIVTDIRSRKFSLLAFYERRARRILPALFFLLLCCTVAVALVGDIDSTIEFGNRLIAVVFFVANFQFWLTSGYFDAPSQTNPLLHIWSLAVEEQFYLAFPFFMLMVARRFKQRWVLWTSIFFLFSFLVSVWLTRTSPTAAFFLPLPRSWELLLGSLIALGAVPALKGQVAREVAGGVGIAAVLAGIFLINPQTPFPGFSALLPCVGTALLIHSGGETAVGRILSLGPVVFVGAISYSLYLWHWPLIVFADYQFIDIQDPRVKAAIIALSFLAAIFSWRFVEEPFRRKGFGDRRKVFMFAGTGAVAFSLIGFWASGSGWLERFPPEALRLAAYSKSYDPRRDECRGRVDDACVYGASVEPAFVVWGDSHAGAVIPALGDAAARYGQAVRLYYLPGCPPSVGFASPRRHCRDFQERVLSAIRANPAVTTVIFVARYAYYSGVPGIVDGESVEVGQTSDTFLDAQGRRISKQDYARVFDESFTRTLQLVAAKGRKIVLVYPVPEPGYNVPNRAAWAVWRGLTPIAPDLSFRGFATREARSFAILDAIAVPAVRVYPHKRLCTDAGCPTFRAGEPLYRDDNHLSLPGAGFLSPEFDVIFGGAANVLLEGPHELRERQLGRGG